MSQSFLWLTLETISVIIHLMRHGILQEFRVALFGVLFACRFALLFVVMMRLKLKNSNIKN